MGPVWTVMTFVRVLVAGSLFKVGSNGKQKEHHHVGVS